MKQVEIQDLRCRLQRSAERTEDTVRVLPAPVLIAAPASICFAVVLELRDSRARVPITVVIRFNGTACRKKSPGHRMNKIVMEPVNPFESSL